MGCDALNGEVKTAGWVEGSGLDYVDFAKQMESFGVKTLIFTDIATDGMLSGPSFAALERLQKAVSWPDRGLRAACPTTRTSGS